MPYIVVLKHGVADPASVAAAQGRTFGFEASFVYAHALTTTCLIRAALYWISDGDGRSASFEKGGDMGKRLVGMAALGVLALATLVGSPAAQAATPQGSCPPTFDGPVAISSLPGDLQGFATFIDTQVGGNNDGQVCVTTLASKSQGNGTRLNILDNRVAGF